MLGSNVTIVMKTLLAALAFSTEATAVPPEPCVLQAEPPRYPDVATFCPAP